MNNDSLGFMNYQSGLVAIEPLSGTRFSDNYSARLNTDSITMRPTDGFGIYTEPGSNTGYAPIVNPAFMITAPGDSWEASIPRFIWLLHSPAGETITVYGWWYQDDDAEVLIAEGNLSVPFVCPPTATALVISPVTLTLGSCSVGPTPPSGVILSDSFAGVDGTLLQLHAPNVGGPWLVTAAGSSTSPTLLLSDSTCVCPSIYPQNDGVLGLVATGTESYTVTLVGTVPTGQSLGAVARFQDATHYWMLNLEEVVGSLELRIYEVSGGVYTILSSTTTTLTPPASVTMTLSCTPSALSGLVLGASSYSASYASGDYSTSTVAGFRYGVGAVFSDTITLNYAEVTTP